MEGQADDGREAPALLVNIEREVCEVSHSRTICLDMAAIVAVVVVGAETGCGREAVEHFIGEIDLTAINILLALHLSIELVGGDDGRGAAGGLAQALGEGGNGAA